MSGQRAFTNDWFRSPDPRTRWRSLQVQAAFVVSGRAASARGIARPRAANVKAASTAKAIATSRSTTRSRDFELEVDGGIKVDNIHCVGCAGATTFFAGSAILSKEGYSAVIGAMRAALDG